MYTGKNDDDGDKVKIYYNMNVDIEVKGLLILRCKDYKFDIKGLDTNSLIETF